MYMFRHITHIAKNRIEVIAPRIQIRVVQGWSPREDAVKIKRIGLHGFETLAPAGAAA
jgi:hypothetical protein